MERASHRERTFLGPLALRLAVARWLAHGPLKGPNGERPDILRLLLRLRERHGDLLCFRTVRGRKYLVCDPDLVHGVLHAPEGTYVNGRRARHLRPLLGNGLLVSDGEHSQRQRRLIQQSLTRPRVDAFLPTILEEADAMLSRWAAAPSSSMNISEEMTRLSTRVILRAIFGAAVSDHLGQVATSVNRSVDFINRQWFRIVGLPLAVPTGAHRRFRRDRAFLDDLIGSVLTCGASRPGESTLVEDIVTGLRAANGSGVTPGAARDEVITLCSAGQLTTANALVWSWYVLSANPSWRDRLVEEIDSVVGPQEPTAEILDRLSLLDRVMCETLRLYPPVWVFTRRAVVDAVIGATPVAAGSEVILSPFVLHRHPDHWPDPDRFDPDRFLPEAVSRRNRSAYMPFGSGPRRCIGAPFAVTEIKAVLVRVLQCYCLDLATGCSVTPEAQMSLRVRGGLRMSLRPRGR